MDHWTSVRLGNSHHLGVGVNYTECATDTLDTDLQEVLRKWVVLSCRASRAVLEVKNLPASAGDLRDSGSILRSGKIPLEEDTVTHSSILAWRIPWTEEPGGLQSVGSKGVTTEASYHACGHYSPTETTPDPHPHAFPPLTHPSPISLPCGLPFLLPLSGPFRSLNFSPAGFFGFDLV